MEESMWTSFHAALVGGERWEEFDRVYGPLVRDWAGRHHLQAADAADVAQAVFLRLVTSLRTYDRELGAFRPWLRAIVRNLVLNHLRTRGRRPADAGGGGSEVFDLPDESADDLATRLSELADSRLTVVEELRARCNEQTWSIVVAFSEGLSAAEVAARLNIERVGTVHQAIYRVRQMAEELRLAQVNASDGPIPTGGDDAPHP